MCPRPTEAPRNVGYTAWNRVWAARIPPDMTPALGPGHCHVGDGSQSGFAAAATGCCDSKVCNVGNVLTGVLTGCL